MGFFANMRDRFFGSPLVMRQVTKALATKRLPPPQVIDEDVRRRHVAVNDTQLVRIAEGLGHVANDVQAFFERRLAGLDDLCQRLTIEQLEHEKGQRPIRALPRAQGIDVDDVVVPPGLARDTVPVLVSAVEPSPRPERVADGNVCRKSASVRSESTSAAGARRNQSCFRQGWAGAAARGIPRSQQVGGTMWPVGLGV